MKFLSDNPGTNSFAHTQTHPLHKLPGAWPGGSALDQAGHQQGQLGVAALVCQHADGVPVLTRQDKERGGQLVPDIKGGIRDFGRRVREVQVYVDG